MRKAILAIALAPLLAGCQPLDAIEGKKSALQIHHEHVQALTIPTPAAPVNLADGIAPEPVVVALAEPAPEPEPVVLPTPPAEDPWPVVVGVEPDCVPEFRVRVCS